MKDDFLERVMAQRAAEQTRFIHPLKPGRKREKDPWEITGPKPPPPPKLAVRKCRGCLKVREHTKGYCLKCYTRYRMGRSLEFLEDDDE